ncbi:ABC transporter permease [Azospirillum sp. ST 5-10]|uniref:ABC transporter permease n=1 Tax=unclassified Azospirillum TaxID=2630922 RepID=UPI003F4A096C
MTAVLAAGGERAGRRRRLRPLGLYVAFAATAAALLVLTVYPMVWLLIGSLREDGGYGLSHFLELRDKFAFADILVNSWVFALGSAGAALAVGIVLAVLVARTDVPFKRLARLTAILAFVSPPWLTAMAYVYIASPNAGFANLILDRLVGVKPFDVQSMGGMIFVTALFLYSFVFLTVEAALASVDGSFEEAARVSGARPMTVIRTVTLPLVAPAIVSATAFSVIIAWGLFAVPAILGMPVRIYVFATQLYLFLNAFPPRLELAAAMGVVFVATALAVGLLVRLTRRRRGRSFAVVAGKGARAAAMPLGRWRPAGGLFVVLVTVLSVAGPYVVILWMSLNARSFGAFSLADLSFANFHYVIFEYFAFWQITGNSLKIAAMEVTIVLLVATLVCYFVRRTTLPGRALLQGAAMYTVLVPSVAFLTAVMWAWIGSAAGLYGGLLLIAMTQAARSLPIATRNIGDGFGQIDRALEEAASVCGAGRARVTTTVTLPLLRPVLLATFTLVVLSALRDLNTPLFLGGGSTRSMTLPVLIFQLWSETRTGEAAALTIVLLAITLVIFLPVSRAFRRI